MASTANSVVFARSPAGLNDELLDYSKSDDVKIYQSAIAPMTLLYDGEPGGLLTFLERLIIRADLSNSKNIIMTPDSNRDNQIKMVEKGKVTWCFYYKQCAIHMASKFFKVNKKPSTTLLTKSAGRKEAILPLNAAHTSMMGVSDNKE